MTQVQPPQHVPDQVLPRLRVYQAILRDFSQITVESIDVSRLLQLTCVQAARGIDIGHTKVLRHRPEQGDLLIVAGSGWRPGVVGHVSLGSDIASPPGRVLQTRSPSSIDDLPASSDYRYSQLLREHGIISVLNVPIITGGSVWGVLEVDSQRPRHFGRDDETFLMIMATMLGGAIQRLELTREAATVAASTATALAEQQTLMQELLHRDKNDFQLIISLLMMQQLRVKEQQARRGFAHVMDRVTAISMAHDQLSLRGGGQIDFADYLHALCGSLDHRRDGVRVLPEADSATMAHDRVVPLGLIVNELVTNALKYAFPEGRQGRVRVVFQADAGLAEGWLCIEDDGVGMGPRRPGGSGLDLVETLARQIGGRLEMQDAGPGTRFELRFLLVR
jgi:two-component sensor histidine kinase